jgi:hypothetical protein
MDVVATVVIVGWLLLLWPWHGGHCCGMVPIYEYAALNTVMASTYLAELILILQWQWFLTCECTIWYTSPIVQ